MLYGTEHQVLAVEIKEKRKRNLRKVFSSFEKGERRGYSLLQFREHKEKLKKVFSILKYKMFFSSLRGEMECFKRGKDE